MKDLIERQLAEKRIEEALSKAFVGISGIGKSILQDLPSAQPLSENNLTELEGRFGKYVRYVVEDMISGKGERWKDARSS